MHCVLIEFHPMVGVDLHLEQAPPPPPPAGPPPQPFYPHFVAAPLNYALPPLMASDVEALHGRVMQRGTDIQSLIPHIPIPLAPYNLLAMPTTAFSGSKSYFGVSSVEACGKPIAVALMVLLNPNLNCGTVPLPTGRVVAPNTVVAGMTWGDLAGGVCAMFVEATAQAVLNCLLGPAGPWGSGLIGLFVGSPLGFSFNSDGEGVIGFGGRAPGLLADFLRGVGESLLGDDERGRKTRERVVERAKKEIIDPFLDPTLIWGDWRGDVAKVPGARRAKERVVPPAPRSHAFDNPAAEEF